jgi:hypothetical protein
MASFLGDGQSGARKDLGFMEQTSPKGNGVPLLRISTEKIFSFSEANALIPLINRITETSELRIREIVKRLEVARQGAESEVLAQIQQEVEDQVHDIYEQWQNKVVKLGGKPKGVWLCDFDNGSGYFCWKYPEPKITHRHGYQDGFSRRIVIE